MSDFPLPSTGYRQRLGGPFVLESGDALPGLEIAYRTWGHLSRDADNAVVVCHALTGSHDVGAWWEPLLGKGRALDPERDFIVCSNVLGGCYGTTGPGSTASDGRPWGSRFPRITVRDQVRAQVALADALGIRVIRLVIGGSMGGLQALEWAQLDPERVRAVASIAAAARHPAWCIAWSEAQRLALASDAKFAGGDYDPADPPVAGLAAARAIAMLTYRSPASLGRRFARKSLGEVADLRSGRPGDFAVAGWLRHHGESLTHRFDANAYRVLLDAMDSHDLARGRGPMEQVLARTLQPALVVSIPSDALYPPFEQDRLAAGLAGAELRLLESDHGHDGFLIDAARLAPIVHEFRTRHAGRRAAALRRPRPGVVPRRSAGALGA